MAWTQVWDSTQHIFLGNVIYAHHYVYADFSQVQSESLSAAFAYQVDLRVGSIVVASARLEPLANGQLGTQQISANIGSISGEVDDWGASAADGSDCSSHWSKAATVHFLVVSKGDVTAALADLISLVPAVAPILKGVATFAGSKVRLTIAHDTVVIPIHRDTTGRVIAINSVPVAEHALI